MTAPLRFLRSASRCVSPWNKLRSLGAVCTLQPDSLKKRYYSDNSSSKKSKSLNLAKPGKAKKKLKSLESSDADKLSIELVEAVKDVASTVQGDTTKVTSDLLKKLVEHEELTEKQKLQSAESKSTVRSMIDDLEVSEDTEDGRHDSKVLSDAEEDSTDWKHSLQEERYHKKSKYTKPPVEVIDADTLETTNPFQFMDPAGSSPREKKGQRMSHNTGKDSKKRKQESEKSTTIQSPSASKKSQSKTSKMEKSQSKTSKMEKSDSKASEKRPSNVKASDLLSMMEPITEDTSEGKDSEDFLRGDFSGSEFWDSEVQQSGYRREDFPRSTFREGRGRSQRPFRSGNYRDPDRRSWDENRQKKNDPLFDMKLFDEPPLGVFSKSAADSSSLMEQPSLFDELQVKETERQGQKSIPRNFFEYQIDLTKQDRMWTFPVDNEEGTEEEAKTLFHEHIFFDDLLRQFPKSGPIRHFIELVTVGLSNNPHITAQQKRDHILWFKDYFEDKYQLLQNVEEVSGVAQ